MRGKSKSPQLVSNVAALSQTKIMSKKNTKYWMSLLFFKIHVYFTDVWSIIYRITLFFITAHNVMTVVYWSIDSTSDHNKITSSVNWYNILNTQRLQIHKSTKSIAINQNLSRDKNLVTFTQLRKLFVKKNLIFFNFN